MDEILESAEYVAKDSRFVKIDIDKVKLFAESILPEELESKKVKNEYFLGEGFSEERLIAYAIVLGSLQFCFWGEPKWTIEINGEKYDGSNALTQAIKRSLSEGFNFLDPQYLSSITEGDLSKILRGQVDIPLFKERLLVLQKIGNVIYKKYNNKFGEFLEKSNGDICSIVRLLVNEIPEAFNDTAMYKGQKVYFYKRAQIIAMYLYELSIQGYISYKLYNKESLSGLADYKAPQILRELGILNYEKELSNVVDNKTEIPSGSDYEIEIRASTIVADELISQALKNRISVSMPALIHRVLWLRSQNIPEAKPYHRVKTIWY